MLILTRKPGESLYIGDNIKVTIVEIKGNQIRVGIEAPSDQRIYREEIYLQILDENKKAAQGVLSDTSLEQLSGGWNRTAKGSCAAAAQPSRRVSLGGQSAKAQSGSGAKDSGNNREVTGASSPKSGNEE
jgi:carbon storage regulator